MAYIPLHHKYRPQTFADLVGQEAISTTLTNALRLEKIAPAYLFTGPRGTGKTSSARILAKSLNCMASDVPTAQPCGKCETCSAIAVGAALDIIEIDAASNTGVDNIRELIERAQYAPVQCRYKVYIIDECHMLTTAAFNSLLKTLEEPPDRVVFVLATTDPQRVLPTIISRCQRFDYRRIPVEAMVKHLTYIAGNESIEIDAASIKLIAQIAQGGLRDAESLLDRLSLLSGEITPDRVYDAIGSVPERDLLDILQSIDRADPEQLLDRTRQILERGKEPLTVLQNLAGCYRDLTIAKTAPQRADLVALTSESWTELAKIAKTWQLSQILTGQKHLKDSEIQLKHTTQPQLWLEIAILGLLELKQRSASTPPSVAAIPAGTIATPTAPTVTSQPAQQPMATLPEQGHKIPPPAAIAAPANAIATEDITATWERVLQQLLPASRDLFKPFGTLISISEAQAVVAMKSSTMQTIAAGKVPELAKVFSNMFGRSIAVKLEVLGKSQPQSSSLSPTPSPAAPPPVESPPVPVVTTPPPPVEPPPVPAIAAPPPVEPAPASAVTSPPPVEFRPAPATPLPVETPSDRAVLSPPDAGEDIIDNAMADDFTDDDEDLPESTIDLQPLAPARVELLDALSLPSSSAPADLFAESTDFAEPPDSIDLERAANSSADEPEEPEIDLELDLATNNVVKLFNGEIIDRGRELFDRIVNN
ncbi:DNA polymerase III subunit gamma/tau [Chamaesiphon minutus]|uniref:DNA polymerase III subunit gamma/tau n=1 Tax=Chamaesiphon minutus (strain ATCC 27169 / PCC 6605) TaxID=1173020 RepID=K9UPS5_CHAP6|nr:DNA polymerase III subunit gamma/tau [Chamaesiphon minutus]AFY96693.1 DNA polymerase III, subunit gamma/tau [Chamaesiphon minutus PCC 6605]